jgi:hypothetical protein
MFWSLLLVAVLAAGSLNRAVTAKPSTRTGALVAVGGVILLVSLVLAARILIAAERARRPARSPASRPVQRSKRGS